MDESSEAKPCFYPSHPNTVHPVHPRRKKTKDGAETPEQFAPKHPASFYDGDEQDGRGWKIG
jgi:hypothetical protein